MNNIKLNQKLRLYLWLFKINLQVSCFTFGGGYVIIPMLRKYYVENKNLLSEDELINMAAVAQSTPGAIAINLSGLCGYQIAGIIGTCICCIAAIIPPIIILTIVERYYDIFRTSDIISAIFKGMEAGVVAIMLDFVIDLCRPIFQKENILLSALVPIAFISNFFLHIHVAIILLSSIVIIISWVLFCKKRGTLH